MTSRIAYILAPDIHAATAFAGTQGWTRLGAARFTNADRQDIRFARNPGEMNTYEFPTDIYREWHWRELSEDGEKGWKWDASMHKVLADLVQEGHVVIVNEVPEKT